MGETISIKITGVKELQEIAKQIQFHLDRVEELTNKINKIEIKVGK